MNCLLSIKMKRKWIKSRLHLPIIVFVLTLASQVVKRVLLLLLMSFRSVIETQLHEARLANMGGKTEASLQL